MGKDVKTGSRFSGKGPGACGDVEKAAIGVGVNLPYPVDAVPQGHGALAATPWALDGALRLPPCRGIWQRKPHSFIKKMAKWVKFLVSIELAVCQR